MKAVAIKRNLVNSADRTPTPTGHSGGGTDIKCKPYWLPPRGGAARNIPFPFVGDKVVSWYWI